ncbi:MAG TPA: uroporphyrinogen-III C-methyltransferase [Acetobacteraceae bacterium]|nr:uroporphyrinogen-III C-methyltransferase [Acetobacteraceae bacterium]
MTAPALQRAAALRAPDFAPGSVWLVGAGPGDPGLLTLHAVHALALADVVLHDALVAPEILALAEGARLEPVGKRAGRCRTRQMTINQRLIALARGGARVVRLKGGDPLVFGRGGEEALALAAAGISFRIVPGISAGIGATAAAGIPLTHRRLARSVGFATGHGSGGALPEEVDWAALSRGAEVLVLYMARHRIGEIAARLLAAGRAADQPVAFIADATTTRQRVHLSTLGACRTGAPDGVDPAAPVLIVIGSVASLQPALAKWQQTMPMQSATSTEPAHADAARIRA